MVNKPKNSLLINGYDRGTRKRSNIIMMLQGGGRITHTVRVPSFRRRGLAKSSFNFI